MLDEQPVLAAVALHADQGELALELLAVEPELELSGLKLFEQDLLVSFGVGGLDRLVGPLVPDHHRPGAVVALGDRAFKRAVFERMIFHLDREAPIPWGRARGPWERPSS